MTYAETMQAGAGQYADVLKLLSDMGLPGEFTQTGGMCAALEVTLENGLTLLVTDDDDSLPWDRQAHRGWGVGLYDPTTEYAEGHIRFEGTADGSPESLVALIQDVLNAHIRDVQR